MVERTREFGMTYGLGPAGYDVRIEFDADGQIDSVELPPGKFMTASTIECFNMPTDIIGFVYDKSTWARKGLSLFNTVIEPGWCGYLTLELSNQGHDAIVFRRGMPIAQVIFQFTDEETDQPYEGKYQNQRRGPVRAIMEDK